MQIRLRKRCSLFAFSKPEKSTQCIEYALNMHWNWIEFEIEIEIEYALKYDVVWYMKTLIGKCFLLGPILLRSVTALSLGLILSRGTSRAGVNHDFSARWPSFSDIPWQCMQRIYAAASLRPPKNSYGAFRVRILSNVLKTNTDAKDVEWAS